MICPICKETGQPCRCDFAVLDARARAWVNHEKQIAEFRALAGYNDDGRGGSAAVKSLKEPISQRSNTQ